MADEMLGRLARYLRFFGHDVAYARGLADGEIARIAERDGRELLTRDRALARSFSRSILIESPFIGDQLRQVRAARPRAGFRPTFDRCPECNEPLQPWSRGSRVSELDLPRAEVPPPDGPVFVCRRCPRRYWDGSHTRMIRARVETWLSAEAPE